MKNNPLGGVDRPQMIIWGGTNTGVLFNDTFSYSPGRAMILYQRP